MQSRIFWCLCLLLLSRSPPAHALDNGFNKPPMGWSALYGAPFSKVDERIVRTAAEGLASGGLREAGYTYVNLDDWYAVRDPVTGKIQGSPATFPSGMANLSAAIHAQGLRFGVYSAASQRTCANWSASLFREEQDARTFALDWRIDYLKYDSCLYNAGVASRARYLAMGRALNATGRPILYSVEGWSGSNQGVQGNWGPELANIWRTGSDIWPRWDRCILNNLYQTDAVARFMVPGRAFNDPDMLQPPASVGGSTAQPGLSFDEAQAQFVLWAAMKAPLVLGTRFDALATLKTISPEYYALVTHEEIIAIDQDPSPQAVLVSRAPSAAQQAVGAVPLTLQACDPRRADQRFVAGSAGGASIAAAGTSLCVAAANASAVVAAPCGGAGAPPAAQQWPGFSRNGQLGAMRSASAAACLSADPGSSAPVISPCVPSLEKMPPPLDANDLTRQLFVWDSLLDGELDGGAIVSGRTGACLTLGRENMPNPAPQPYTNNGTLQHEVWAGPLSTGKRVVVLFNKGTVAESVSAARALLSNTYDNGAPSTRSAWFSHGQGGCMEAESCAVRDVLARKALTPLAPHAPLAATVPAHGVRLFVVG